MQMGVWGQNSAHEKSPSLQVVEELFSPCEKTSSCVELSLWLSRACLGNCSELFQV